MPEPGRRFRLSQGRTPLVKSATELGAVASQYEKWVYPFPIADLDAPDVRTLRDGGDFERNWHTYWPDRPYREHDPSRRRRGSMHHHCNDQIGWPVMSSGNSGMTTAMA